MGRKIFVSYKFADDRVENLVANKNSTVRDYVTEFESMLDSEDGVFNHIYKGEKDGNDLSEFSEEVIWSKLRDRIYDSTLTIVFISPGMKEIGKKDCNQWIPWEISYSLKETSRKDSSGNAVTSKTNAMLAVVLPNVDGTYSYFLEKKDCCSTRCTLQHCDILFQIMQDNMFNLKEKVKKSCNNGFNIWESEEISYIGVVKWYDFKKNYNKYINAAYERQKNIDAYNIVKILK